MRYKKGDLVIVDPDLKAGALFDNCLFTREMEAYKHIVLRVERSRQRGSAAPRYNLSSPGFSLRANNDLGSWAWVDEMLLPVQDMSNEGLVSVLREVRP